MTPTEAKRPVKRPFILFGVLVIAAIAAVGLVSLFSGPTPDAVDIASSVDQLDEDATAAGDGDAPDSTDPTGTWTVDQSVDEFSYANSTGTFVGFRIDEELSGLGAVEAVGRIPAVEGTLTLDGGTLSAASFSADVATLTTDDGRRDRRARAAFGTETVAFELTDPLTLDGVPSVGTPVSATATGVLTVNGVEATYDVPLDAVLSESGVLVVTGSFEVLLSDHDVVAPSAPIVLSVADTATVEFQLLLTR